MRTNSETQRLLPRVNAASTKPPPMTDRITLRVCSFILAAEFCVYLASATLTGSLPIYFRKHVGLDSVTATELTTLLTCLFNLSPILGAYVADTHWGRFHTIAVACVAYVVGLTLCTLASTETFSSFPLFVVGLYGCITLAAGGIKPNVVVLGADQFDVNVPAQRVEKESFFNWFYWTVSIGSFTSYAVLANIAVNGWPPFIPEEQGFVAAFSVATLAFVVGAVVFYSGKARYRRVPPQGSALRGFLSVVVEASGRTRRGAVVVSGAAAFVAGIVLTTTSYFVKALPWHMVLALGGAGAVVYGTVVFVVVAAGDATQWVNAASDRHGGSHRDDVVRDVRDVVRLLPFMSILIVFWAAFSQIKTNFQLQGCQLDLRVGSTTGTTLLSPASLTIVTSGTILTLVPVVDRVVYPALAARGLHATVLRKIGMGLGFATLAMVSAGAIERERKTRALVDGVVSNCVRTGAEALPMSQMTIWWQALPYVLVGVSEILTGISSYDLFYSEAPASMRSACQALNLLAITLGFIVSGALNSIFSFWVTTDLNDGKLENIFFVVAALLVVNMAAFVVVSRSFQYKTLPLPVTSVAAVAEFMPTALVGHSRAPGA